MGSVGGVETLEGMMPIGTSRFLADGSTTVSYESSSESNLISTSPKLLPFCLPNNRGLY